MPARYTQTKVILLRSFAFVISHWIYGLFAAVYLAGVVIQVVLAGVA
jgi:hypothetical protein